MESSEKVDLLAGALAGAQAVILPAPKDAINPHFKNRYADLAAVWEACRGPLSSNKLAVVQAPEPMADGHLGLRTTLLHASGQWTSSTIPLIFDGKSMQSLGSAITYARRYALCAMVGIVADVDDDGAGAGSGGPARQAERAAPAGGSPARRPAEAVPLRRDKAGRDGVDGRDWRSIRDGEAEALNEAVNRLRVDELGLLPSETINPHQLVNHVLRAAVAGGAEMPAGKDGKPPSAGAKSQAIADLYRDATPGGWRDWIRAEVRDYLGRKHSEAVAAARAEAGLADEPEPGGEPVGAAAGGKEGWAEGRE